MFGSAQRKLKILFGLSDVVLTVLAFVLAYTFRRDLRLDHEFFFTADQIVILLAFSSITCVTLGYWQNIYGKVDAGQVRTILADSFRQCGYEAIALILLEFSLRLDISRVFLFSFVLLNWIFLLAFRLIARNLIPMVRRRFGVLRYVLIAGQGERAQRLAASLESYHEQGLRIFGFLACPGEKSSAITYSKYEYPVYPLAQFQNLLRRHVIDEVHFAVDSDLLPSLEDVLLACDDEGVCSRIAADFFPMSTAASLSNAWAKRPCSPTRPPRTTKFFS